MMKNIKVFITVAVLSICSVSTVLSAVDTPITLRLTNADVSAVLRTIAAMGDVNLVVDDSVTGKITLQLNDVPFEQALEIITKSKNLTMQRIGNTLIVASKEQVNKGGFTSIQVIRLQYAKAEDIKKSLVLIVPEERIKVDAASNTLLFNGTPNETAQIKKAVEELDKQLAQVVIEAEVVEINRNSLKDVGVSWDWTTAPFKESSLNNSSSNTDNYHALKIFHDVNIGLQATVHAKIEKGEGKILAKPRIMALNNQEARIHIGNKVPVVEYDKDGNKSVSYIEVGIKLDITPQISENNTIVSKVKTEVSDATYNATASGYEISTRESETTVRLRDGETLVIGGLYNSSDKKSVLKVPLFGDLPLVGKLFRAKNTSKHDTEIIVLLKPTIAKSEE